MSDPISLFIIAVGCLIIVWRVSACAINRLGRRDAWDMEPHIGTPYPGTRSALSRTDQLVSHLEQQWREGLLSREEAIQASMQYDGFEAVELLHSDGHVERIELPPTALDQFHQLNDAVVTLTEAIQASFPSVHDIHGLFAGAAEIDRSAWVADVSAAPKHWTLGDDGEIISDE